MGHHQETEQPANPDRNNGATESVGGSEQIDLLRRRDEALERMKKEYKTTIEFLAEVQSDLVFPNSNPQHASYVLATLIKHASKSVFIYEDKLDGELAELNPDIEKFLTDKAKNPDLEIVIVVRQPEISPDSKIRNTLRGLCAQNKNVRILKASSEFQSAVIKHFSERHTQFAVVDGCGFRAETNDGVRRATCSFNRSDVAAPLKSLFEKEVVTCTESIF